MNSFKSGASESSSSTMISNGSRMCRMLSIVEKWLILDFNPGYFVSIMGVGITSNILYSFPYEARWLRDISYIFFAIACIWFLILLSFMFISMYRLPEKFLSFHVNPAVSPFMGCLAMGYMTIINFIWAVVQSNHDKATVLIIWAFWWVSVILSLYTSGIVFVYTFIIKLQNKKSKCHENKLEHNQLNLPILLPIVALTVAASQGNLFVTHLPSLRLQIITIVTCFILWSIAVSVAFMIMTINFWKLFIHKLPATSMIFTSFLPVGFLGQGSFGICLMGNNLSEIILTSNNKVENYLLYSLNENIDITLLKQILANIFVIICSLASLFLIGMGYFMTFIAILSIFSKIRPFAPNPNPKFTHKKYGLITFNRGFWAMTFPLGTMSLAQNELSKTFGSGIVFFKVMSSIYAVALIMITTTCILGVFHTAIKEIKQAWYGEKRQEIV